MFGLIIVSVVLDGDYFRLKVFVEVFDQFDLLIHIPFG